MYSEGHLDRLSHQPPCYICLLRRAGVLPRYAEGKRKIVRSYLNQANTNMVLSINRRYRKMKRNNILLLSGFL